MSGIKRNEANGPDESTVRGKTKKPKTLGKYLLVSATQTIVEFGSFILLHLLPCRLLSRTAWPSRYRLRITF